MQTTRVFAIYINGKVKKQSGKYKHMQYQFTIERTLFWMLWKFLSRFPWYINVKLLL